mgnify:CR=1 FL=1
MLLTVCSNPDLLSVMYLVNQIINVLKIVSKTLYNIFFNFFVIFVTFRANNMKFQKQNFVTKKE